ncbi:MAG: AraC family transcriptional regulator [Algicola sp.]|nr:AraC family transcriptional regulator [Algicola sp.]
MQSSISILLQLTFFASTAIGLVLLFTLYKFRDRNPRGYCQVGVLIVCFSLIILEQWLIWLVPESWSYINRTTTWIPLLFGPCFWLFAVSLDEPHKVTGKSVALHYLPGFVCLLYFLPYLLLSGDEKNALHIHQVPLETYLLVFVKVVSMMTYLHLTYRRVKRLNSTLHDSLTRWLMLLLRFFITIIVLIIVMFFVEALFVSAIWIPADVIAALCLGGTIYFSAFTAISAWSGFARTLPLLEQGKEEGKEQGKEQNKPSNALLDSDDTAVVYQDICDKMKTEQHYLQANLKSDALADLLDLQVHYLSFVVNAQFKDNVQNWLNSFRVEQLKTELANNPDTAVLDLALGCGFNSKATFNRAFKRFTDMTPSEYKNNLVNNIK